MKTQQEINAQHLIGSLIAAERDTVPINTIFSMVKANDLPNKYAHLFRAMHAVWKQYNIIEPATIHQELKSNLEGDKFLSIYELFNQCWSSVIRHDFWEHYLRLVLVDVKVKEMHKVGKKFNGTHDIDALLAEIKRDIDRIEQDYTLGNERGIGAIMDEYLHTIDSQHKDDGKSRLNTGLYLDKHLSGFRPGDYIVLAGRPKMGKSAIANHIVVETLKHNKGVMYVNLEMDETSVMNRIIANYGRFDINYLNRPETMGEEQMRNLMKLSDVVRTMPLSLQCLNMRTMRDVYLSAKKLQDTNKPLGLIVLDYLGLFQSGEKHQSLYQEVTVLSRQIKLSAGSLGVPVLALAQLNRECEQRVNKRPVLSDLRDSGAIEQDATAVMFAYRDDYYNPESEDVGLLEINVAANRNGTTGTDKYRYDFNTMSIENLSYIPEPPAGSGF